MQIWRLTPADPNASIWKEWSPKPVFVRAGSEAEARHLAQLATLKLLAAEFGKPIRLSPLVTDASACEDITAQTNEFSAYGPAVVLRHGEKC